MLSFAANHLLNSDARCLMSSVWMPDARCQMSDARCLMPPGLWGLLGRAEGGVWKDADPGR